MAYRCWTLSRNHLICKQGQREHAAEVQSWLEEALNPPHADIWRTQCDKAAQCRKHASQHSIEPMNRR